jgi:acyl dehydratase
VEGPDGPGVLEGRYGRCLENFVVGDVFLHWPGRTVTEGDHQLFCLLTNSLNPIHVDRDASSGDPVFGRVVVVGTYIYALLAGMSGADVSGSAIANLGVERLEHTAPLYPGDTLYAESEVLAVRPATTATDRGVVSVETRGWNQDDAAVCRFTRTLLVWRRAALPPRPLVGARRRSHAL